MEANNGGKEGLLFLNIRSLRLHHAQLCVLVDSLKEKPLVIASCETWLTDNDFFFSWMGIKKGFLKIGKKRVAVLLFSSELELNLFFGIQILIWSILP